MGAKLNCLSKRHCSNCDDACLDESFWLFKWLGGKKTNKHHTLFYVYFVVKIINIEIDDR